MLLGPGLACKLLEQAPLLSAGTGLGASENPCHHWFLCGNRPSIWPGKLRIVQDIPALKGLCGYAGGKDWVFPGRQKGSGNSGTLLFCTSQPASGGEVFEFPQLQLDDIEGLVRLVRVQVRQPDGSHSQVSQLQA